MLILYVIRWESKFWKVNNLEQYIDFNDRKKNNTSEFYICSLSFNDFSAI